MVGTKKKKTTSRSVAILGIFTAILLIQNFIPFLGNIPIPPINLTIIHVTVILATLALGTVDGMVVGGIWGLIRFIKAIAMPMNPLDPILWSNPVITIVPKILVGLTTGISYKVLKKFFPERNKLNMTISAVIGSITHTLFVLLFIYIFFYQTPEALVSNFEAANITGVLLFIVGTGGIPEFIFAGIVSPLIAKPLQTVFTRLK